MIGMRPQTRLAFGSAVVLAVLAAAANANAQEVLGTFSDWTAFTDKVSGKQICYVGSKPKKAEGNYSKRDDAFVLVTHRPAEKVIGEVSIETGYAYKAGSSPQVAIGDHTFTLFSKGTNAWAKDAAADRQLVAAMKGGSEMVVKGTSSRGTATTDTYSLSGFSAAYTAIGKACGV